MKVILRRDQLVRLIDKLKELIQDKEINPKEFILINKNRNGIKYSLHRPERGFQGTQP